MKEIIFFFMISLCFMNIPVINTHAQTLYDQEQDKIRDRFMDSDSKLAEKQYTEINNLKDKIVFLEKENTKLGTSLDWMVWLTRLLVGTIIGLAIKIGYDSWQARRKPSG